MQRLFYVVCRWLQNQESKQADRMCQMIKHDMQLMGFKYDDIKRTQMQREQLYRQRQMLIRQKQRLEQQKRQIQLQKQNNLKLIQQRERQQKQRQQLMKESKILQKNKIENDDQDDQFPYEEINQDNREVMEARRKAMLEQFQSLKLEREKIIQERKVLYERMDKIEKLQKLQQLYQEQLNRLRSQANANGEREEEHKQAEEESRDMESSEDKEQKKQDKSNEEQ